MPEVNDIAESEWLSIGDISKSFGISRSVARARLKSALSKIPKSQSARCVRHGSGPHGSTYHIAFVETEFPGRYTSFRPAVRSVLTQRHRYSGVTALPLGTDFGEDLLGILRSRKQASEAYSVLLHDMIASGEPLKIRCVTGTDFFTNHSPLADALMARAQRSFPRPEVLLVYPFGHGAKVRVAAELGNNVLASQFHRDALNTLGFVASYADIIEARWADDLPTSFLVWTEGYALVEPYDHGRDGSWRSGCIGRKAPILMVNGGTPYHAILGTGFDYVFHRRIGEATINNDIRVYELEDVIQDAQAQTLPTPQAHTLRVAK